jgi:kumamolisin
VTLLVLAAIMPIQAAEPEKVILRDSVSEVSLSQPGVSPDTRKPFVSRSSLTSNEEGALLEFEVTLKMRNFAELQQRIDKHEIISPAEMAEKYDPTAADEQSVADWLSGLGLVISRRDKNHLAVFVRGTVSHISEVLKVNFARVTFEGSEYTSAITAPSVPSAIAPLLVGINGLQPHLRAHKHSLQPNSLYGTGAPYLPSQIAQAYNVNGLYANNVTGAGQTIAIVIDTFPAASDLTSFWQTYSVNQSINNISFIQVVSGTLPTDAGEATLDTEWASSIAPGAQVRVYATTNLSYSATNQAYQQIYSDATNHPEYGIHQVSLSYGGDESTIIADSVIVAEQQYFANLASAGVAVFASSGDGGSTPDSSGGTTGPVQVEYPASDPNVTGVGGTTYQSNYYTGGVSFEYGWSLSGGGTSGYFSRPSWQSGVAGMPSGNQRCVPDVASAADPNYGAVVILNGAQLIRGGTSWSTPTWAGYCALINQARASASLAPIGAINSSLYALSGTASFTDITSGNNGYSAGVGYDLVTGIGVPNVQNLVQALAPGWQNSPETILHSFQDGTVTNDGLNPATSCIQGTDGNFYGTTANGGASYAGVVYKVTPQGAVTILHSFSDGTVANDGDEPEAALVQGTDGNFYGTTQNGGTNRSNGGTAFKITAQGVETILHNFNDGSVPNDGFYPTTALVEASDGNLYGTTAEGGTANDGTIFQMTPSGTVTILHSFGDGSVLNDGVAANGLTKGSDGNLYGTTNNGGTFNSGTIFKITLQGAMTILHNFGDSGVPNDGMHPGAALIQASDGNFYGTTYSGGSANLGTIFQMTPQGAVTIFHSFSDGSVANDGMNPDAGIIQAANGNFYGTTAGGGSTSEGTIFQMTPQGVVTILHNFYDGSVTSDGVGPQAGVIQGADGNLYGVTEAGGTASYGTIFKLSPKFAPRITSLNTATFTVGLAGSFTVTATGNPTPTLTARYVPSWASFNATTGVLSGTPTTTTGQPYTIVFTANNGIGGLAGQTFTLNVQSVAQHTAPAITSSAPSADPVVGTAYNFSYLATGSPAPAFSLASGALPTGLSLSAAGVLSGTPIQTGTFTGTVKASNGVGTAATQAFSLTVERGPSFVGGSPSSNVMIGTTYSFTYAAVGSPSPTFSLTQGGLPPGLTLTSAGAITGTPTEAGQFNGTVTASNSVGTDTSDFVINVNQAPSFTSGPPTTTAILNLNYSFSIQTGGYPLATILVTAGSLPPGIYLNGNMLSGYPYESGTFTGTFTASNGVGTPVTQDFSITVGQPPSIGTTSLQETLGLNTGYDFTFNLTGGSPTPTMTLTSGALPPGMTLVSGGYLSGTPTQTGTFSGTVLFSNGFGTPVSATFVLTVDAPSAPVITNGPPPATGTVGFAYGFTYLTTGYPTPTFSLATGSLPPGVGLSSAGVISGVPTQPGTYTGTISAGNGLNPAATQAFSIVIAANTVSYAILHNFEDGTVFDDGGNMPGGLIEGTDGNFYGVTQGGGSQFEGTVFKITPQGVETILHNFNDGSIANDGEQPTGPLVRGSDGNFYGTTQIGGASSRGTLFKITPQGVETIVYAFGSVSTDGSSPYGSLTIGTDGNFYGTTTFGGSASEGIAFKITPQGVETILHNFGDGSVANDGTQPHGGLIQASDGNFYGMTASGGSASEGTIFKMTPAGTVTILHSFEDGSITDDGFNPQGGLLQAPDGNLYGVTKLGGISGSGTTFGTFFKITLSGTMTMVYRFGDGATPDDALQPWDSLILGSDGNFYGTSYYGGTIGYGSIFEITPQGSDSILHSFNTGTPAHDGLFPEASLVLGTDGNMYGGTTSGGTANGGEIFQLSLSNSPTITSANSTTFTEGYDGNFVVTANGNPAPTFSATGLPSWANLNATTGVLSGTPPGTTGSPFTFTLTATNGNSPNATQSFTLNVRPTLNFSEWEASFPNPITSGPSATPKNDGIPNLLKYLYDIDPTVPMSAADWAALPEVKATTVNGTNYLTITYREYQQLDSSVSVSVQTSSDLQNWTTLTLGQTATATTCTLQQMSTDPNTGDPIMQATVLVTGGKQFIRLQVTP